MPVFCANCGNKLDERAKFCSNCGRTVNGQAASTLPQSIIPPRKREPIRWRFNSPHPPRETAGAVTRLVGLVFVIALIVGGVWFLLKALPGGSQSVTDLLPVDCYVGITSQAATITVSGVAAGLVCDRIVSSDRKFYRLSQAPTQPIMCERTIEGYHFTVRDQGLLKLIGNQLCSSMQNWAGAK